MSRSALTFIIIILLVVIGYLIYRGGYLRQVIYVTPTPIPTMQISPEPSTNISPTSSSSSTITPSKTLSPSGTGY